LNINRNDGKVNALHLSWLREGGRKEGRKEGLLTGERQWNHR